MIFTQTSLLFILLSAGCIDAMYFRNLQHDAWSIYQDRRYTTMQARASGMSVWILAVRHECLELRRDLMMLGPSTSREFFASEHYQCALQERLGGIYDLCKWSVVVWAYSGSDATIIAGRRDYACRFLQIHIGSNFARHGATDGMTSCEECQSSYLT